MKPKRACQHTYFVVHRIRTRMHVEDRRGEDYSENSLSRFQVQYIHGDTGDVLVEILRLRGGAVPSSPEHAIDN